MENFLCMLNTIQTRSKAIRKCFLRAVSNGFIRYIEPTLQNSENQSEATILHMRISNLLQRCSNIEIVTNSIMNVASECNIYGIKNIFSSGR